MKEFKIGDKVFYNDGLIIKEGEISEIGKFSVYIRNKSTNSRATINKEDVSYNKIDIAKIIVLTYDNHFLQSMVDIQQNFNYIWLDHAKRYKRAFRVLSQV